MPYQIWLTILVFIPLIALIVIGFSNYNSSIDLVDLNLTLSNLHLLIESQTLVAYKNSFLFASVTTLVCFVLGYLVAYQIKQSKFKNKFVLLTIIILPMWSNLILRTESLLNIMEKNNILNSIIGFSIFGDIAGTQAAVLFGLIFTYMPFMILPIYTALEKIDFSLIEASNDLGLTPFMTFWKVTFPLSLKGVITGSIMVFLSTIAGFAVPKILGKGNLVFIGNIIDTKFLYTTFNDGSLLAIVILVFILGALLIITKIDKEGETLL
ncbi:MAG: ABC transporter permease [Tenericutes bacterium]|nr:ABC transporter permease [Mycoplasmatota bacterium]